MVGQAFPKHYTVEGRGNFCKTIWLITKIHLQGMGLELPLEESRKIRQSPCCVHQRAQCVPVTLAGTREPKTVLAGRRP